IPRFAYRRRSGPLAQLDRALPSEGRGREFESRRVRQLAGKAPRIQLHSRRSPHRPPASTGHRQEHRHAKLPWRIFAPFFGLIAMVDAIGEALRQYRDEGYAVVRGFFAPDEVAAMAASFDRHWQIGMTHRASFRHGNLFYRQGKDPALGKILRLVQWPSYVDATLERVRRDPRWRALLEPLLGPDVKQIINQLHWKPPGAA